MSPVCHYNITLYFFSQNDRQYFKIVYNLYFIFFLSLNIPLSLKKQEDPGQRLTHLHKNVFAYMYRQMPSSHINQSKQWMTFNS